MHKIIQHCKILPVGTLKVICDVSAIHMLERGLQLHLVLQINYWPSTTPHLNALPYQSPPSMLGCREYPQR